MRKLIPLALLSSALHLSLSISANATVVMTPTAFPEMAYESFLSGQYNSKVTPPEVLLGFEAGERAASPEQINDAVRHWAAQSDRVKLVEYALSYEDRPLHYLVISSPKNLANLERIKANIQKLANPSKHSKQEISRIIENQPATAWMAYSIHGNESSGADAALAFIYHLLASDDAKTKQQLDDMVIIVDPMMNPDGRARFTKKLEEHRGAAPNVDTQSLLHTQMWPYGRTNHYYFDLNRDFYFTVNPETRGRVKAINDWYPQLMIDGHEMGALDNYLMGPPRTPINPHIPASKKKWGDLFSNEQGQAFDEQNWPFYTGEWFENLYPGYSNYAEYRGSVHILYEQARTAEDGVRLKNGSVRSYQQSVHHQFVSTLANIETLRKNRKEMYLDFVSDRLEVSGKKSRYADRSFVVMPSKNKRRMDEFVALLQRQNIAVYRNDRPMKLSKARNQQGQELKNQVIEAGALVIPNRQAEARLIAAILEFDTEISQEVLLEERQKTLRDGSSLMYDTTAWNVTMMYGLNALQVPEHLDDNLSLIAAVERSGGIEQGINASIGYYVDGDDDASVGFAARLLEQGVIVRVLDKATELGENQLSRGSVVVSLNDNVGDKEKLKQQIQQAAEDTKVWVKGITQGAGTDYQPDIGSSHFSLLKQPQIAILANNNVNTYDMGSVWHLIDTRLGIRHSHIDSLSLSYMDLSRYNVLVLPDIYGRGGFDKGTQKKLKNWVNNGGTLIAFDGAAQALTKAEGFTKVTIIDEIAEKQGEFNLSLQREWLAKQDTINNGSLVNDHYAASTLEFPWQQGKEPKALDKKGFKRWQEWTSHFMPSGAMVTGSTDQKHWLTYGSDDVLPVLIANSPIFMSDDSSQAVVRFGDWVEDKEAKSHFLGWAQIPDGYQVQVRMSGLVWPEAQQRIANGAYLTRERSGAGQIILFSGQPNFRGAAQGTARLLLNALVYGPGMGTKAAINL